MNERNLLSTILIAIIVTDLFAQPGELDLTFDSDGIVTTDFYTLFDYGYALAVQPDGRIIVAGISNNGPNEDFALVRYNTDGTLDITFNTDGKVMTDFAVNHDEAYSIALQSDGKIVVAGLSNNSIDYDFALARYNIDGTLDNNFSTDGKETCAVGTGNDYGYSVALQSDGKIIMAGWSNNGIDYDFAVVRFNPDGTLDNTFGTNGKLTTSIGTLDDYAFSVAIQANGKIVVAGQSNSGVNDDFAIVRYNSDGTLDNSFSIDGKLTLDFNMFDDAAFSLAIQPDDKIIVSGASDSGTSIDFALARYSIDGSLDNSFSTDGKLTTDIIMVDEIATSMTLQPDGKIVAAGSSSDGVNHDFALARYNMDGALDIGFSTDGKLTTSIGVVDNYAFSVALQPDGKIVVAGWSFNGGNTDFALARYISGLNVGMLDFSTFNNSIFIYPNPITQSSLLEYELKKNEIITIRLLDVRMNVIKTLINNEKQEAGIHNCEIDISNELASGSYYIVFSTLEGQITIKLIK